jgi:hypothetical protein
VACRPFRLEEITELLAVEVSRGFVDPGDRLLGGWSTLSRACGPFLQINELGVIELIHVSAKEFLLSHPWATSLAREYLMDGSAETEMACLCLSYLNFMVFGRIPGEDMNLDVDSLTTQYPLIEYASHFCEFTPEYLGFLFLALDPAILICQENLKLPPYFLEFLVEKHRENITTLIVG